MSVAAIAIGLLLAACASHGAKASAGGQDARAYVNRPAPAWSEPTTRGATLSLASLRGNVIYLNFFATWCPPCNEEAPAIEALARAYRTRGLRVVGVDVLENARKAAEFAREHHLSYPIVVDDGTLRDQYAIDGLPVHVFIDRAGVVRTVVVGEMSAQAMRDDVTRLLGVR